MVFNSIQFAIFLPIVFVIYWLLRKNLKLQNLFVVISSYVFYGWWDWRFLLLIAFTSFCSWGSGLLISESDSERRRKGWLIANITINLLILCIFKYFNFFVDSFCSIFNLQSSFAINVILPVGISFYTFQALSYSIDVYRGNIHPTKDMVAFFAYVSFFPQLVAGPIERATNLLPQFEKIKEFDYEGACEGMRRILWGLFKKIVIADNCAKYVNLVWGDTTQSGSTLLLAAVLFAFQVYGDFSGYSDIAIGTSRLFGIRLCDNFLTPFFSRNVAELWKRWHISLNSWFVDYVYIPLGGGRGGKWLKIRNTFVIFLLSGLWHGANWTYVGWGLYHALLFIPVILLNRTKAYRGSASLRELPQIVCTFILFVLGLLLFRSDNMTQCWAMTKEIFSISLFTVPWLMSRFSYLPLALNLAILLVVEWITREQGVHRLNEYVPYRSLRWVGYFVILADIFLLGSFENAQFIYFQF